MKMTERNTNFINFLTKDPIQIDPTVFVLDRSLESLDSECFEDNRNVDIKQSIENINKEINLETVKNEIIGKELRYACDKCNLRSHDKLPIAIHQMIEHKDESYRIIGIGCEACEDGELHKNCDFTKHIQSHRKTEKMEIKPIENTNYVSTASDSKDDMQLIKKGRKSFKKLNINTRNYNCKICDFVGQKSRQPLISHMKTEHKKQSLFQCDSCEYKCNWKANLKTHKQAKHSGGKHECDICGYKTIWKPLFFEHRRGVHGIFLKKSKYQNEYQRSQQICSMCGFIANTKRSMRLHRESDCKVKQNAVQNRMYRNCKKCGFEASNTSHLRNHRYEAHKIFDASCLHCDLKFEIKTSFDKHMREKHPKTGLDCDVCQYKAKSSSGLTEHKDSVHLGKGYACTMCVYIAANKSNLKKHILNTHKELNLKAHTKCNECDSIALNLNSLYGRAEQDFASSLDIEKSLLPRDSKSVASSLYQLGLAQAYSGKLSEAEVNLQAAIRILEAGSKNVTKAENSTNVAMEEIDLEIKEVIVDQLGSLV